MKKKEVEERAGAEKDEWRMTHTAAADVAVSVYPRKKSVNVFK